VGCASAVITVIIWPHPLLHHTTHASIITRTHIFIIFISIAIFLCMSSSIVVKFVFFLSVATSTVRLYMKADAEVFAFNESGIGNYKQI
jgi:hypothetical protein